MIHIKSGIYSWYVATTDAAHMIAEFLKSRGMSFTSEIYRRDDNGYFEVYPINMN